MKLLLLRHAPTRANILKRYPSVGEDEPVLAGYEQRLKAVGDLFCPKLVLASPSLRTRQTAELSFRGADMLLVPGLTEMDFGRFGGHSADELSDDAEYREWVEGQCLGKCPGGEDAGGYIRRITTAFSAALRLADGRDAALVTHGGVIMTGLFAFAEERREYFAWHVACAGGYVCTVRGNGAYPLIMDVRAFGGVNE